MDTWTENYTGLILKIDEFIRKYYLNKIVRGSLYLLAALLTGFICVTLIEYYGNFSPFIRAVLFYGFISLQLGVFVFYLSGPILAYFRLGRRIDHHQASSIIGKHFPEVRDKLLNTLQLRELAERSPGSAAIIESAINQKIAELKPIPFQSAVRLQENRKYLRYALPPLIVIILIGITAPYILSEGSERIIHYKKPFIKKAPFRFVMMNRDRTALQGEDYTVELKLVGDEVPEVVYIEDGVNTFEIEKENVVRFRHTFKNMQKSKVIRFLGGEFFSAPFAIEVRQRPALIAAEVDIVYPAYLKRKNEKTKNLNDLTVPAGTRLAYRLSTRHTRNLRVYDENGRTLPAQLTSDSSYLFRFAALRSTSLKFVADNEAKKAVTDDEGLLSFRINVIPDEVPSVRIVERKDSLNGQTAFFIGQINDDHGFSDLSLKYQIRDGSKSGSLQSRSIPLDRNAVQQSFFHAVTTSDFQLKPGQELEFYFEVRDNDAVNGFKVSRTELMRLNRPSRMEASKLAENAYDQAEQKLKTAISMASEIEREAKKLNRDLVAETSLSFSQKKQLSELVEKHKDLEKLIRETKEESEKSRQNKEDLYADSKHDLEKQLQLEKLLDQALDDETKAMLRNLEEMLRENKKMGAQQEISSMQSNSRTLQKELDRILELYKQLEFEQSLSQTIDQLKSATSAQKKLAAALSQPSTDNQPSLRNQQAISQEFSEIGKRLEALEKKNKELERSHSLESSVKNRQEISKAHDESRQALQNGNNNRAQRSMQEAASKMDELVARLEKSRDNSQSSERMVSLKSVNQILNDLLKSSFDQEKLLLATRSSRTGDPLLATYTRTQMQIKDNMKTITDSLYSLSRSVPQIESTVNMEAGSAANNIASAIEDLAERRFSEADRHQQNAMTSMNNLALLLGEVRDQLEKAMKNASGKGKGQQQTLSQMIGQQNELNKNMQKMREQLKQNSSQSGKQMGTSAVSEKMAQMAREQSLIRHALQDFNRQIKRDGVKDIGHLEKLAKDMEQTETDLVNKRIQLETMNRQQDILARLLQADKSDREREMDDKRESRHGLEVAPAAIPLLQQLRKIKARETDYLRTIPPNLNSFYQLKVGDYFRSLTSK